MESRFGECIIDFLYKFTILLLLLLSLGFQHFDIILKQFVDRKEIEQTAETPDGHSCRSPPPQMNPPSLKQKKTMLLLFNAHWLPQ